MDPPSHRCPRGGGLNRWLGSGGGWPLAAGALLLLLAEGVLVSLHLPGRVTFALHGVILGAIAAGAPLLARALRGLRQRHAAALRQAEQALAARESRFRALIEQSADGLVLLSPQGIYTYASPATSRLLGYTADELVGRSAFDLLHPADREGALARTLEALRTPGAVVHAEVRLRHKDGTWRWIEATVSNLLTDPAVQALVKNYHDITARKETEAALRAAHDELEARVQARTAALAQANADLQAALAERVRAEAALQENRAQLAGIIGAVSNALITIDEAQRIVLFNAAAERLFQVPATEVLGQPVQRLIPARSRPTHQAGLAEFARSKFEQWWVGMLGGAAGLRSGGSEFPFEASISQVEVGGRKLFTISLHDISEQQAAAAQLRTSEEQLRALAARLLFVREEERASLAWEIQDRLGQALAVLKMDLTWVAARLPAAQAVLADRVRAMAALTNRSIQAVRQLATELRPGVLDDLGLVAALEWQAEEFQTRTGLPCECEATAPDVLLGPAARTALFRLCQEALTNVARHAQATRVTIRVEVEAGALLLCVSDDGRGITVAELAAPTSLGLLSMQERARRLGGEVAITGAPGQGTTVTVRVPLPPAALEETRGEAPRADRLLDAAS